MYLTWGRCCRLWDLLRIQTVFGFGTVGNIRVGSVTSVELRRNDNKHYYNDESPYKCRMKQEHETLTTRIMYLPRVLPNGKQGQVLGN
jgi:hypothetical protein